MLKVLLGRSHSELTPSRQSGEWSLLTQLKLGIPTSDDPADQSLFATRQAVKRPWFMTWVALVLFICQGRGALSVCSAHQVFKSLVQQSNSQGTFCRLDRRACL